MSKYSNHEKMLEDYENEDREGFKVEVNKRPDARGRGAPTSSGRKGDKNFSNKFGQNNDDQDMDDIEEEEVALQDKEIYLEKIVKRVRDYEVKVLNPSRENKKLLVLDIDYTLFDHR